MHLDGDIHLSTAQVSEAGLKARNEDCLGFFMPVGNLLTTKGACALIADGVSTAEAGAEAAEYSVREFLADYFDSPDIWTVKKSAQKVLTAINRQLYARSHEYLSTSRGHLCTLSVLILKSRTAHLFHIGDSRIYRLRAGSLECLTEDHLTRLNESSSCLSRALGMDTHLEIDYRTLPVETGDLFLLSTDGIHDFIAHDRLRQLAGQANAEQACRDLVNEALQNGSHDNLSCQLVRVDRLSDETLDDLTDKLTALPFPPELMPGLKIDGYEVIAELYASSRSQLYEVKDLDSGRPLVMKTPSVNYCDDPAYIERFVMEEWVGSRIDSPHVVRVETPNRPKTFLYYLMEKVDGVTLDTWIAEHPDPQPREAIEIVRQIAEGLKAFHSRETLHQDLKPGNILITPEAQVKIVDFGSVHVAGIDEIFVPLERDRILGTVHYSDPLLRLGHCTGIRGDIFSMASICYEIFTGHLPYGDALERCQRPRDLRRLSYIPANRFNPILPVWFDRALEKALSPELESRYDSLESFLNDLTHPNPELLTARDEPIPHRGMLVFWQLMSLVWFVSALVLMLLFWLG
ncbi:protein kinase [Marinobacterium nitratireducens]|uniref:Protein kinase n=2 Tax=Marinobacterium nitratireducens TaxID=518897 RepID=A0A918DND1_9GAMM|nr:protein kinase [Marinobacterium nitratireducens]